MAVRKSIETRNAACNTIVDRLDTGSDWSSGRLALYNSDSTVITMLELSIPAYGDSTDGTSTAYLISDATSYFDATASTFSFLNRDGTAQWSGDITEEGQGGDMQIDSTIIPADTTVSISSAVYIVPA